MRAIITADIHCGYPGRLDDNIWSLNTISNYAEKNDIDQVICLGDLFHNRDYISIDVLNAVHEFFKNSNQEWTMFPGNHDMFLKTSWDINSVKPLEKYANVYNGISSFKMGGRQFFIMPFMHYESEYMNKLKQIEKKINDDSVLLTHIGVNNAKNNSCFLLKHWSLINFTDSKFKLILSGHFHNHQFVDKVCYPGSPIPFKFDEGMVPHGFIDLDIDNLSINFINIRDIRDDCPHDFITITDDMIDDGLDGVRNNKIRVALNREYSKSELDTIRDKIISAGAVSAQWMKLQIEDTDEYKVDLNKNDDNPPFIQWLETQDNSKYDEDLLISLYESISEEAEDAFIKSKESDES